MDTFLTLVIAIGGIATGQVPSGRPCSPGVRGAKFTERSLHRAMNEQKI